MNTTEMRLSYLQCLLRSLMRLALQHSDVAESKSRDVDPSWRSRQERTSSQLT